MRMLFASTTVLFTILFCLAFGIGCGYVAITMILRAFGHKPVQQKSASAAVVATTASGH